MLKNKRILMVVAPKNFKDEEYYIPKEIFESMGLLVSTCSTSNEALSAAGRKLAVDVTLDKATSNYDAIMFVGGPGAIVLFDNEKAWNLARDFLNKNKLVAAICIAPSILANSGILQGKRATAFPSEEQNLLNKGALYTGSLVTIDKNIITGKNPGASRELASQIIKILGK